MHLMRASPNRRLHVALTHGMAPFEQIGDPNGNAYGLLYRALREAAGEPKCNEREIVKAYRKSWACQAYDPDITNLLEELKSEKHYPNSAELLRTVIGTHHLSGGITELDEAKHRELATAWTDPGIDVARSSWRERQRLSQGDTLGCPKHLDAPWLFSMDPMTYSETGKSDDANLHRSDMDRLARALEGYVDSGQPGIASLFVFSVGSQGENRQRLFWSFMDELAGRLRVPTSSYWVHHQGGNRNLAGLLFSKTKFPDDFVPPCINSGRGV